MGHLSDYIEREALNQGIEQGVKQGIEQGIEQGVERGAEQQLVQLVVGNRERGRSYEQIADVLMIPVPEVKRLEKKGLTAV